MKAFVRKLYNGRYYLIGGMPDSFGENSEVLGEFITRRQAIRYGESQGYDIVINRRAKESEVGSMGDMMKIRLTDYKDYHSGVDGGVWLELPATVDDLDSVLSRLGVPGGEHGMDYFITDFDTAFPAFASLNINYIRRMSIDELNYIAGSFENADRKNVAALNSLVSGFDADAAAAQVAEATENEEIWGEFNEIPEDYMIEQQSMKRPRRLEVAGQLRMYDSMAANAAVDETVEFPGGYRRDKLKETLSNLKQGIKGVFDSDKYQGYLNALSKFHRYSYSNCVLIAQQKPGATFVAGLRAWETNFNRKLIHGEEDNAIKIIAPDTRNKKMKGNNAAPSFKVVNVYDISQTHGQPIHELGADKLTGSVNKFDELFEAVKKSSPVPVVLKKMDGGTNGYFDEAAGVVAINRNLSEQHKVRALVHEIAHARLHNMDKLIKNNEMQPDRQTREVEAESIAYAVSQHYGIDTSAYSFSYIAAWSGGKNLDELKKSLTVISKGAKTLIGEIDEQLELIPKQLDREKMISDIPAKHEGAAAAKTRKGRKPSIRSKLEASKREVAKRSQEKTVTARAVGLEV